MTNLPKSSIILDMEKTIGIVGSLLGVVATILLAFVYLEKIHIDVGEMAAQNLRLQQHILYTESTRYAEVAKYYYDLRLERELTPAEETRLSLVEGQLERVSQEMKDIIDTVK